MRKEGIIKEMKVYIDLQKLAISKVVDGTSPEYAGDINSNVFEILFFNYDNTNWFPTMSQLAPNGREAGDFEADSLGVGETHDYTEDGVNYQRFTFTMGNAWVLMKGRSNLFVWYNVLNGAVLKKCVGKLNVMINESNDNYFISNPVFNPAVKSYINGLASDIEDDLNDKIDEATTELNDKVDAQNATIASLSQASPSVFDTAANIQLLQENKGVAVATDTGYIWYWDSTLTTPAYVSSGLQYNAPVFSNDDYIDSKTIQHTTIGNAIRAGQDGQYVDSDVLPINKGLKKYEGLPFKKISVNSSTGEDATDLYSVSTRRDSLLTFTTDLFVIIPTGYRLRLIKFNSDGTFNSSENWQTNGYKISQDDTYKYRIQIATNDGTQIVLETALSKVLFYTQTDKIDGIIHSRFLDYEKTPMSFYASKLLTPNLEMSNIYQGNGGDSATYSGDCCRTPNYDRMLLTEDVIVYNKDISKYRFRIFEYASDGSYIGYVDWQNVTEYKLTITATHYYRFAFATYNQNPMDINDIIKYIGIYYASNSLIHNSIKEKDNFAIVDNKNTAISMDEIPDYWKTYLDNKIAQIKPYLTDGINKIPFLFLTDTHYYGYGTNNIRFAILKYLASRLNIGLLLHGGDLNSEHGDLNTCREFMLKPVRMLQQCARDFLIVRGNHDDNLEGGRDWSLAITSSDSYSYMFRQLENKAVFGDTGTYYYYDLDFQKTRFICMDIRDLIYDSTTFRDIAFTHKQLEWACNVLLNTPNDYKIIILLHSMLAPSIVTIEHPDDAVQSFPKNYLALCDILKAYKNHTSINIDLSDYWTAPNHQSAYEGTLSFDFSNNQAEIIGVVSGHEHVDCIEEILDSNGNGIGIYNTCTQNDSALFSSSIISYSYQHQMTLGTITEQVFDLFVVDKKTKHVDIFRIGAGDVTTPRGFNY